MCSKYSTLPQPDPAQAGLFYFLFCEENVSDVWWWLQEAARLQGEKCSNEWGGSNCKSKVGTEVASGPLLLLLSVQPVFTSHWIIFELWKQLQLQAAACQSLIFLLPVQTSHITRKCWWQHNKRLSGADALWPCLQLEPHHSLTSRLVPADYILRHFHALTANFYVALTKTVSHYLSWDY